MLDHECFCNHDHLFDRIQSTHENKNIILKFISNEPNENESPSEATDICDDNIQKKNRTITNESTKLNLQIKRQKRLVHFTDKLVHDFRLVIVDPIPKLDTEESNILYSYFGI